MKWFHKLKIGNKLLLSFSIVAIIATINGLTGIKNVNKINQDGDDMYNNNAVPLTYLVNLTGHFNRMQANALRAVVANEYAVISDQVSKGKEREAAVKFYTDKFEETLKTDDIRTAFKEYKDAQESLLPLMDRLFDFAEKNDDAQAELLITGEIESTRKICEDALTKLTDLQIAQAKTKYEENDNISNAAVTELILFIVLGFLAAITLGIFIARLISKPIVNLAEGANKIASGDYSIKLDTKSEDEIGTLTDSFNVMTLNIRNANETVLEEKEGIAAKVEEAVRGSEIQKKYLVESVDTILLEMNKFADGDLTVSLEVKQDDEIGKLYKGFNKAISNIKSMLEKVSETVTSTAKASNQISSSSEEMAAGAFEQSAQTKEVASAVEEMTKTILDTTNNSTLATEAAKKSGIIAHEGGKVVSETIEGMNRISDVVNKSAETVQALGKSSNEIGEIIQVIDDIADQTNLLALNAAIEAARAGEQGRGFAVVADEVRKLAERTTKATKEIAVMIKSIQRDTSDAVKSMKEGTAEVDRGKALVDKAGESLEQIIKGTEEVVDITVQVAAASEEQSTAAEQISKNIESINNVTQESTNGIQQIAKAAEDLNNLTINLQKLISNFKIDKVSKSNHDGMNGQNIKSNLAVRSNGKIVKS
jgi:methyl-accepting chemotaxis protein